jgi:GTP cyclohydrolase I
VPRPKADKRFDSVVSAVHLLLEAVGAVGKGHEPADGALDLRRTPVRVARMLTTELLAGYARTDKDLLDEIRLFEVEASRYPLVVQTGVSFTSLCAHHLLPFTGTAAIGYLPHDRLVGLSKFTRIVDHYAARLQIQERLGDQIVEFLMNECRAGAAIVMLRAEHHCMACRGVKRQGVKTVTSSTRPVDIGNDVLTEFYRLVEHGER